MKSNFLFFLGIFAALGVSWAGIVLGSNAQLGGLAPYYDEGQSNAFPEWIPGEAARGQLVYRDLGCAACHTQQVRRPGFGSDQERGWGERQSVARDYIYQPAPQLGLARVGPDLANLGDRKPSAPDADDILKLLYTGAEGMPSYRFLFERRHLGVEAQPSDLALKLTGSLEPPAGEEIVPTERARALATYLATSKSPYAYPEAVPVAPPKPEGEAPAKDAAKPASPAKVDGAAPANGAPKPAPPAGDGSKPTPAAAPAGTAPAPDGSKPAAPAKVDAAAPAGGGSNPTPAAAPAKEGST